MQLDHLEAKVIPVALRGAAPARIAVRPFGSFVGAVEAAVRRLRDLDLRSRRGLDGDKLIAAVSAWTPG